MLLLLTVCIFLFLDHDIDDLEMQVVRYKPEGLDILCRNTKFTKKELQIMYRGFKQVHVLISLIYSNVISLTFDFDHLIKTSTRRTRTPLVKKILLND